jgi:hypothetical protein
MVRRATILFWTSFVVVNALGLRSSAQSVFGFSHWLPNSELNANIGTDLNHCCRPGTIQAEVAWVRPSGSIDFPDLRQGSHADNPIPAFSAVAKEKSRITVLDYARSPEPPDVDSQIIGRANPDKDVDVDAKSSPESLALPHDHHGFDREVYYRNKFEFAFDGGWLPMNIPFVFDVFLGDSYNMTPLRYTLVPLVASLRWHINDVGGPWILRGNWDMTFSGSLTVIPRGPETHYFSYDMGIRRNFVPRRGKVAPYFDGQAGLGRIDAKEPLGVEFAQGQNFTFTLNLGSGARYNFNPRYSVSAGLHWMHISNLYFSEPAFSNYGINVWGPMFGMNIRLTKPRHVSE